jgi:hypothetical protein
MKKLARIHYLIIAIWLSSWTTNVKALVGDSDEAFGLDASLRTTTAGMVNYDYPLIFGDHRGDGISQTLLRLTAGGNPTEWLSYEIHGVQDLTFSTIEPSGVQSGPLMLGQQAGDIRYRVWDASWSLSNQDQLQSRLWLDRCNIKLVLPWLDVTIGRQAITFGKAYFYNPLDVFLAFNPTQFDRDYKAGVDAIKIDIPLGDFSGINLVGVLGRRLSVLQSYQSDQALDADWYGSALLARVFTNFFEWDFALQSGKVYGGYQLGGALSGELFEIEVRMEAAYLFADDDRYQLPLMPGEYELESNFTAVLGVGRRFENTLTIEAEYLFNGLGDPDNLYAAAMRLGGGNGYHMGKHIAGLVLTYEILPILNGSLAWLFSFSDYSSLVQPGLSLSVSDESDFVFGALIGLGKRPTASGLESEFGTYPNIYYMEYKFYF